MQKLQLKDQVLAVLRGGYFDIGHALGIGVLEGVIGAPVIILAGCEKSGRKMNPKYHADWD